MDKTSDSESDNYRFKSYCPYHFEGRPSIWGNPFSHLDGTLAQFKVKTRKEAIEKFEIWIEKQPELMKRLPELKGMILGCWCAPKACHGEVLCRLANERIWL